MVTSSMRRNGGSPVITEISGQVVIDLCNELGVDHRDVYSIEISPRSMLVVHEFRRSDPDKGLVLSDPPREPLRRHTDVAIRWSGVVDA